MQRPPSFIGLSPCETDLEKGTKSFYKALSTVWKKPIKQIEWEIEDEQKIKSDPKNQINSFGHITFRDFTVHIDKEVYWKINSKKIGKLSRNNKYIETDGKINLSKIQKDTAKENAHFQIPIGQYIDAIDIKNSFMFIDDISRDENKGYETYLSMYEPGIKFHGELPNKMLKSFLSWGCMNEMQNPFDSGLFNIQCPIENNKISGMPVIRLFDIANHVFNLMPSQYFIFPSYREKNRGVLATFAMS